MLDILSITTPIFVLIGVGYLAVFGRIVSTPMLSIYPILASIRTTKNSARRH